MSPLVYIIILNFNRWDDSYECIESCSQLTYGNYKILLIDNNSDEDLTENLIVKYPEIIFLQNSHNTGFSSGCNLGIKYALSQNAEFVWLLNNDTVVNIDSLTELITNSLRLDNVGILSPKIYFYQSDDIWSSGGYINNMAMAVNYTDEVFENRMVGFVTGCAMLVPVAIFSQYGLLKDDYFLNVEDWEMCRRLTDKGKKVYVVGSSTIYHKVSRSKKGGAASPLDTYYTTRNRMYFIAEYYGFLQRMRIDLVFSLWWPIWLLRNWCTGNRAMVKSFIRGVLDYTRGIKGCSDHYFH